MSGNKNRNCVKKSQKRLEDKYRKKYHDDIFMYFQLSLPAIAYGIIFFLQSIIDTSPNFSIILALFSLCVTLSFELNEWCTYFQEFKNKTIKIFNYFPPLLFMFILLILFLGVYRAYNFFIGISAECALSLPNIITSMSLFLYFISYIWRKLKTAHYTYLLNIKKISNKTN